MEAVRCRRLSSWVGEEALSVGLEAGCAENSFVFSFFLFIVMPSLADAVSVEGAGAGCSTGEDGASAVEGCGMSWFHWDGPSDGGNSARSLRR